jgi:hypothetical protein
MDQPQESAGMREVTNEQFFAALYAQPLDIMPSFTNERWAEPWGYVSIWKHNNRPQSKSFGVSAGTGRQRYWLA